jgi:spore coat assembly protein SafA
MSDKKKTEPAASNEAVPCSNSQLYTIKPGDTLFLIAKRFNVSLASLRECNPQIVDPNVIYPGQVIVIPMLGTAPATRMQPMPGEPLSGDLCRGYRNGPLPPEPLPGASCPNGQIYRVVCGDTMFKIAQRFGVSLETLVQANPQLADPNLIYPGQEICIPGIGGEMPSCVNGNTYTVKAGDTLFYIARRNGVMLSDLIAANPQISDPDRINPGQVICIPTTGAVVSPIVQEPPQLPTELPPPGAPPLPVELPVELPPPLTPAPCRPLGPPYGRPMPRLRPPAHPLPRPCPGRRPRPAMPLPAAPPPLQTPVQPPPCGPYPMPVYVVVPWDECPYRSKCKGKSKKRKHDRKKKLHHCH